MKHVYLLYWHWDIETLERPGPRGAAVGPRQRDPDEIQLPVRCFEVLSDAFQDALERLLYGEVEWDRAPISEEVHTGWIALENQRWSFEWEDVEVLIVRVDFQGRDLDLNNTP